jgi:LuxR family maltose regulon positive regulatory protein
MTWKQQFVVRARCLNWANAGQTDTLTVNYTCLDSVLLAMGDMDGAAEAIGRSASRACRLLMPSSWLMKRAWIARAEILSRRIVGRKRTGNVDDELHHTALYLVLARTLVALGKLDDALRFLARLLTMVEAAGARLYIVRILVLQAVIWRAQGRRDQALTALGRALKLAKPEGLVRSFVDSGEPVRLLIADYGLRITDRNLKSYTDKLLAAFGNAPLSSRARTEIPKPIKREIPKSEISSR